MSKPDGLSDFLTFISPICIIVLFFLCLFRFLFSCCSCTTQSLLRAAAQNPQPNDVSTAATNERPTVTTRNCNVHSVPILPAHYNDYDPSSFFAVPFVISAERFPPKYEDAIKMPSARRASCSAIPPPPFYDSNAFGDENVVDLPPDYWAQSRSGISPIMLPSASTFYDDTFVPAVSSTTPNHPNAAAFKPLNTANPIRHAPLTQSLSDGLNTVRCAAIRPNTSFRVPISEFPPPRPPTATIPQTPPPLPGLVADTNSVRELRVESLEKVEP